MSVSTTFTIQAAQIYAILLMDWFYLSKRNLEKFLTFSTTCMDIGKIHKNIWFLFAYYSTYFVFWEVKMNVALVFLGLLK